MRPTRLLFLMMALLAPCCSFTADMTTNVELKTVAHALQPLLEPLDPKPKISFPGSSAALVIAYQTQTYKIHSIQMDGEVLPKAHDELGPGYMGFLLVINLQDAGVMNQAFTPQTMREPYWRTDLDVTPLAQTHKQIYWRLSYGVRTDTNLLTRIRQTLHSLERASNKSVDTSIRIN